MPEGGHGLPEVEKLLARAAVLLRPYVTETTDPPPEHLPPPGALPPASLSPGAAAAPAVPVVQIRCFGGLRVAVRGTPVNCGTVRPKVRSLLRVLALHAGTPVHRDVLLDALWPDLPHESGVRNLQVTVSRLRVLLEPGTRRGGATLLTRDEHSYGLALGRWFTSDVREFDRHAASCPQPGREAGGDPERQAVALRAALRWYGGDLLPEEGAADWVVEARGRLRGRAARLYSALAGCELRLGRAHASWTAAEQALALDPYLDEAWRTLVAARERGGDAAGAANSRRAYARTLRSLGVPPEPAGTGAPSRSGTGG
ncbi:BTAD domain-containing putative transcriptional regulator [Streptomyces sp. TRM 70351]|uniref:AfsR/SARP family transcriptional regulator n=1 Tax=Streptomyces sp. TRM 70351 TaxID=3116552 RepID=UPI002E7BBE91|nr:BTAD domain-containing putative transcriptional regulator [Streptomyces sp. TRM 70351]MEE1927539.1 BTAD domain-containing putative transcriptional regulator [Streptomyces sp. TRM 70351]